eukprot:4982021-Lingulodinium_polyedra.AAC.1
MKLARNSFASKVGELAVEQCTKKYSASVSYRGMLVPVEAPRSLLHTPGVPCPLSGVSGVACPLTGV